ncbi:MAG: hypothetical protein AMXMBFR64_25530 [Myxococcales bacterium]
MTTRAANTSHVATTIATLEATEEVTRLRFPQGQILLYQTHLPPGAFVFLRGSLRLEDTHSRGAHKATLNVVVRPDRPLVVPPADELDLPAGVTVYLHTDSEVLFIPRTLLHAQPEIAQLLDDAGLPTCSLQSVSHTWESA